MKILNGKMKIEFVVILLLYIGVAVFNVTQPMISSKLLDYAIAGDIENVKANIVYLLIATAFLLLFELLRKIMTSDYKKRITDVLREKLLSGILSKPYKEFNEKNNQKYISLFNNEIKEIVENYYILFIDILFSVFSIIIYSLSLLSLNPILAVTVFVTNLFPMVVPRFFRKPLQQKKSNYLESLQKYNVKIGDAVNGYEVIKINTMRKKIEEITGKYGRDASNAGRKYENTTSCCDMVTALFSYINYLSMIILGVYLIYKGKLTAGGLLATVSVSELLVGPVTNIAYDLNSYYGISQVKKKLFQEYFERTISLEKSEEITGEINKIELKDVSYYYGNRAALKSINLSLEKGKKYLIYGLNGSGKSTLFKILSKMYQGYQGKILVNEVELSTIPEENYYSKLGFLMQDPFMFNDTLHNNLTLYNNKYKNGAIEKIIDSLHLKRIKNMILSDEEYVDSENNISGGERQKINLARIMIQDKKCLFLDEATSAYDLDSYQDILKRMLTDEELTIVNIEHKIPKEMIDLYDEIVVMEDGKINKICRTSEEKKEFAYVL